MATRLYSIDPSDAENAVTEAAGSAIVTKHIELTVDCSGTLIGDANTATGSRAISRDEVLLALEKFQQYILANHWPPV